ncbi:hypothetical protein KA093_01385 [Candidatus Saccharibacteria bacterium]|nr:hypothetical protein [Candidatus Saccharibacteria bacterium]
MVNIGELMSPGSRERIDKVIRDQAEAQQAREEDKAWVGAIEKALELAQNEEGEDDE